MLDKPVGGEDYGDVTLALDDDKGIQAHKVVKLYLQMFSLGWTTCSSLSLVHPGLSFSTRFLLSRYQTLLVGPVAEHSQYLQMDKHKF